MAGFAACSALAADPNPEPSTDAIQPRTDDKVSYALGMNLGAQIKRVGAEVDVDTIAQAVRDVLDGKPTRVEESEVRPLLTQAQAYEVAKRKAEGESFLAKNAKVEGVTTLPDGMQYHVIKAGAGELAQSNDIAVVNFRGTWIDGKEFRHEENVKVMPVICPKGIREVLLMMKPGAKWQIFVPSHLSYGDQMGQPVGFGSTLNYDLEMISAAPDPEHKAVIYGAGRLGHAPGEDFLPANRWREKTRVSAEPERPRENPGIVFPGDAK